MTPRYPQRRRLAQLLAGCAVAGGSVFGAFVATAHADPPGCVTDPWGFLGSQRRTICDQPMLANGGWKRGRVIWTPAHQVPLNCFTSGSRYSSFTNCDGGYFVAEQRGDIDVYLVMPDTVPPGEPGHID